MPKVSTFGHLIASQVIESDCVPLITNAGDDKLVPIEELRSVVGPGWSTTINAANEPGATNVIKINSAIVHANGIGATRVFIPSSMFGYDATLITYNPAIQMVREGGDFSVYDAWAYGATGDGVTVDYTAIQAALTSCPAGFSVFLPGTTGGYFLGDNTLVVPTGVRLFGGNAGLHIGRWIDGTGLNSTTVPGGTMLKVTSTTDSAVQLGHNSTVQGCTFWYPNQLWGITSLGQSFVAYPSTILLGPASGASYNQQVLDCFFLGCTTAMEQYDNSGANSLNNLHVENCAGVVMGPFVKAYENSDPLRFRNISINPGYAIPYVVDGSVGGDAQVFRTKVAQGARFAEFGRVRDVDAVNVYGYGMKYFVHYKKDTFSGDPNTEYRGRYVNCLVDVAQAMFCLERSSGVLFITGSWATPVFRPNGVGGDNAEQALVLFDTGVSSVRIVLHGVQVYGTTSPNFVTNYTGQAAYAFRARGALGASVNIIGNGEFFSDLTSGVADSLTSAKVTLGIFANEDVMQEFYHPKDANFLGGYRHAIDGWYQDNLAVSQTNVPLGRYGTGAAHALGWMANRAGSLTSVWAKSNADRTAGTCGVTVWKNGAYTGLAIQLNGSNLSWDIQHSAKDAITFISGDVLDLRVTTSSDWAPTTADVMAGIEVET